MAPPPATVIGESNGVTTRMTPRGQTTPRGAPGRVKIVLIGNHGVGKSSIAKLVLGKGHRGTSVDETSPTVGVDFATKALQVDKDPVPCRLHLWDTSGQERFRPLVDSHLQDLAEGDAVVVVYDISDEASFEAVETWVKEARHVARGSPQIAILGNKSDRGSAGARKVPTVEGQRKADELGAVVFLETCAITADAESSDVERLPRFFIESLIRKCRAAAPLETPRGGTTPRPSVQKSKGLEGSAQAKVTQNSKTGLAYLCKCPWRAAIKCFAFA